MGARCLTLVLLCLILGTAAQAQDGAADSVAVRESDLSTLERARIRLDELVRIQTLIESMISQSRGLRGEELQLKRVEVLEQVGELEDVFEGLIGLIGDLDEAAADSTLGVARPALRYSSELYLRSLDHQSGQLSRDRSGRRNAAPEELPAIEQQIADRHAQIDDVADRAVRSLQRLDGVGLDADDLWEELELFVARRAESLSGRLQLAVQDRRRIRDRASTGSTEGDEATSLELAIVQQRIDALVASLKVTSDIMTGRGLETAEYDQLVIQTTGSVTEDILDPEVLGALAKSLWRQALGWLRSNGPTLLVWLGLLLLTVVVTQFVARVLWLLTRLVLRPAMLLQNLVNGLIRPASTLIGLFVGLWILGVNPATLLAGIGVLSIVVGLALQDSLGNIAAGIFILIYRPYDVDEIVQAAGVIGRVKEMGLANTTIVTFDRRRLYVPNKKIWSEVIENRSAEPLRRIEATVSIGYEEELDATLEYLRETILAHELVLDDPAAEVFVSKLEDSWIEISVWPWVRAENWWTMTTNLQRVLRNALDERGIAHAFPRVELGREEDAGQASGTPLDDR
jgi:small conductance mechanosensitive channel